MYKKTDNPYDPSNNQEKKQIMSAESIMGIIAVTTILLAFYMIPKHQTIESHLKNPPASQFNSSNSKLETIHQDAKKPTTKTLKEKVQEILVVTLGATVNWDGNPQSIKKVDVLKVITDGKPRKRVQIWFRINDSFWLKESVLFDVEKMARRISALDVKDEIEALDFVGLAQMQNMYGEDAGEKPVFKIRMPIETARRTKIDNIGIEKYERLLETKGSLWYHKSLAH
jgi:hypothetical protein